MATWFYKTSDAVHGPIGANALKDLATIGKLQPDSLVRKGEEGSWVQASRVNGLFQSATGKADPSVTASKDEDQSTYRLQESTPLASEKPKADPASSDQRTVVSSETELRHRTSTDDDSNAKSGVAAKLLSPFTFYWTKREAIWLYFAATFLPDVLKSRRDLEFRVWLDQDQPKVVLPKRCVTCGKRTARPLCDETRIAEELAWSLWCLIVSVVIAIALPVFHYSAWLSVLTIILGSLVGHLLRRKRKIVVSIARCEKHATWTDYPSLRAFGDAVYLQVGSQKVKKEYLAGNTIDTVTTEKPFRLWLRFPLYLGFIGLPFALFIEPLPIVQTIAILVSAAIVLLLLLGSFREIRITKSKRGQFIVSRGCRVAFLLRLPSHSFDVTKYEKVEFLHIIRQTSLLRFVLIGATLFVHHRYYLQIHGEGQPSIIIRWSTRRGVRRAAVMICDATGWLFTERKETVFQGIWKKIQYPKVSRQSESYSSNRKFEKLVESIKENEPSTDR